MPIPTHNPMFPVDGPEANHRVVAGNRSIGFDVNHDVGHRRFSLSFRLTERQNDEVTYSGIAQTRSRVHGLVLAALMRVLTRPSDQIHAKMIPDVNRSRNICRVCANMGCPPQAEMNRQEETERTEES
jgi:hypothetical protein